MWEGSNPLKRDDSGDGKEPRILGSSSGSVTVLSNLKKLGTCSVL